MLNPTSKKFYRLCFALFALQLVSCASYTDEMKPVVRSYYAFDYSKSLDLLEKSPLREQSKNRLLYLLEKATILDRLNEYRKSRSNYIEADKLADELYTISLSAEAASFVVSDSSSEYSGEDYEKVAIHTMLASSFLSEGRLNSAIVEARKINNTLYKINSQYDEKENRYRDDAFARYLAGVLFEAKGNYDSAIIEYQKSLKTYETIYRELFYVKPPEQLVKALYKLYLKRSRSYKAKKLKENYSYLNQAVASSQAEVVVFHQLGNVAPKRSKDFVWTMGDQVVRFSFPVIYPKRSYRFARTGVKVKSKLALAEIAQNYDYIAEKTLEDKRGRMLLKAGARLLLKGQMVQKTREQYGEFAGLVANVVAVATETADTRSWLTLPSVISVTRVPLNPGSHELKIYTDGRLDLEEIKLRRGEVKILVGKH